MSTTSLRHVPLRMRRLLAGQYPDRPGDAPGLAKPPDGCQGVEAFLARYLFSRPPRDGIAVGLFGIGVHVPSRNGDHWYRFAPSTVVENQLVFPDPLVVEVRWRTARRR
jgi:hypothetical protein